MINSKEIGVLDFWTKLVKHFLMLEGEEVGLTDVKLRLSGIEQECLSQGIVASSSRWMIFAELEKCFSFVAEIPRFNSVIFTADEV